MFTKSFLLGFILIFSYLPQPVSAQGSNNLCEQLSGWSVYVNDKTTSVKNNLDKKITTIEIELSNQWEKSDTNIQKAVQDEKIKLEQIFSNLKKISKNDIQKKGIENFEQEVWSAVNHRLDLSEKAIANSRQEFKSYLKDYSENKKIEISNLDKKLKNLLNESIIECKSLNIIDPNEAQNIFTKKIEPVIKDFILTLNSNNEIEDEIKNASFKINSTLRDIYTDYESKLRESAKKIRSILSSSGNEIPNKPTSSDYNCSDLSVGYQIIEYNGTKAAIWYPSHDKSAEYDYGDGFTGEISRSGKPANGCGNFPLIVFSHGFMGCGTQSIFITEKIASKGYVVVAPDHDDALCSVDKSAPSFTNKSSQPSLLDPKNWTQESYLSRKNDIVNSIDFVINNNDFGSIIDIKKIGLMGHSLGGYTSLGIAGGWESWKDERVKAVLLFSPYTLPFTINKTLGKVSIPIMYQGADFDIGITPFLEGKDGAYEQTNSEKYFVKLKGGNHFIWTNLQCADKNKVEDCSDKKEADIILKYSIAFFDKYFKNIESSLLNQKNPDISKYLNSK